MKLYTLIACGLLAGLFSACKDQKTNESNESLSGRNTTDTVAAVQHMNEYHYTDQVKWRGKTVTYQVERHAVDSLPVVTDEAGEQFSDNMITLTLKQGDRELFHKSFYKRSFKEFMDPDFYAHSILEGMAFDQEQEGNLRFAVSVSYPMSDLYIPLLITIRPDGSYVISKDLVLDNVVETLDTTDVE